MGLTKRSLGLVFLVGVVFIWVGSGVLSQYIFREFNFPKPFFLTYLSTAMFSLYLTGFALPGRSAIWSCGSDMRPGKLVRSLSSDLCGGGDGESFGRHRVLTDEEESGSGEGGGLVSETGAAGEGELPPLTTYETFRVAVLMCPIWFVANWSYNASLALTSVASNTVLASTSGLWALVIGACFGTTKFSWLKLGAVAACLGGVVIIAELDAADDPEGSGPETSVFGDGLALFSAIAYGAYVTLLKVQIGEESRVSMPLFFGFVGAINVAGFWPIMAILSWTGVEPFQFPPANIAIALLVNGLVGTVLSDLLWLKAVLLTTPLIATVGLSLTIPLAMLADVVLHDASFGPLYIVGSGLVLAGFIALNVEDVDPAEESGKQ